MSNGKKQTGKVNYVWVLAGGYLLYLAAQLFFNVIRRTSDSPAIGVTGGVVFTVAGGWLLWREWKAYRFGLAHKDDPSTWSDEEPEEGDGDEG
ncbi:hypothetical protein [Dysosmobacter sp.]|uniref:hypothetical protein n=1 Tax=Dysosmobacter sp. TaxID=2591382 RepID=UPI002A88B9EE|nr:hypothetical protein [Dysosmobacter sp.]MDY3985015.1 hypothetical protein [Dysosmobacter sp.]